MVPLNRRAVVLPRWRAGGAVISLGASTLATALKTVRPAVNPRAHMPVLSGVHLHADGGVLDVSATNLDLTITTQMPCTKAALDVVVPIAHLADFVARAGEHPIKLTAKDDLIAETDTSRLELRRLKREDWPQLPEVVGDPVVLDVDALALLGRVLHAAATGKTAENRPILGGVLFSETKAIATDSYRLAVADLGMDLPDVLLPAAALNVAIRECSGPIELVTSGSQVRITNLATSWTFRLIEVPYINWQQLLRDSSPFTVNVDRRAFLDALGISTLNTHRKVKVDVTPETATVTATEADLGTAETRVAVEAPGEMSIGFDAALLSEALDVLENDRVTIGMVDPHKPVLIHEGPLTLLLMPKKL